MASDGTLGMAVDAFGARAYDPSENVLQLTDAAVRRIDDMASLRERLADEKIKRMEREWIHVDAISVLRAEHYREIRHMESDRVDKIRSVDVANAAATAAQLLSAVTTLATTAQATAETLRNQVAATAAAVASQTERVVNPIIERLALLEKSSNFGQGRSAVSDPALEALALEMKKMSAGMTTQTGKSEGINAAWLVLVGAVALVGSLIAIGSFVFSETRNTAPATQPQIIYVPAPAGALLPTTPPAAVPR